MRKADRLGSQAAVLAEVLIALALLIPVIVVVAGLFPYSFSVDRKAWNQRTAQSLARSALEEARGRPFDDLVAPLPPGLSRSVSKDGTTFQVNVTVADVSPVEKAVVCTVTWPRKNGIDQLSLESRIARLYQGLDD